MSALDVALLASSTGHDVEGVKKNCEARKYELQTWLAEYLRDPRCSIGGECFVERWSGVSGQGAVQQRQFAGPGDNVRATLVTSEHVINALVCIDSEQVRVQDLSRAGGARG